jgi:hypothetical protein
VPSESVIGVLAVKIGISLYQTEKLWLNLS